MAFLFHMDSLDIYLQNVRGKLDRLNSTILQNNYGIICLTESWWNDTVWDRKILDQSHQLFRRDRSPLTSRKSEGCGVVVLVKSDFEVVRRILNLKLRKICF